MLDYKTDLKPIWCPGCGDFAVLSALYKTFAAKNIPTKDLMIVSGIGCSSRLPGFVKAYGFHGAHGRTLPTATGIKIANPNLTVIAVGGDGDGLAIGAGHFLHAARRNPDITYIMMDNSIYGLTKGQTSPTTPTEHETKTTPYGNIEEPIDPAIYAISAGATFVSRGFSSYPQQLVELFTQAIDHKGFSFVQVLSPCTAFFDTYDMYKASTGQLEEQYDITNKIQAITVASERDPMRLGVLYKVEQPDLGARVNHAIEEAAKRGPGDIDKILERFA